MKKSARRINSTPQVIRACICIIRSILQVTQRVQPTCTTKTAFTYLLSPRRPHTRPRSFQSRLYSQCLHRPPRATWHWPIHRVALQWGDNSKKVSVSYCGYTLYCCCTAVVLLLYCCWVRIREAVILTCAKHRGPARFVFDLHHWFVQAQQQTYHVRQSWCVLKNREKKKNKKNKKKNTKQKKQKKKQRNDTKSVPCT